MSDQQQPAPSINECLAAARSTSGRFTESESIAIVAIIFSLRASMENPPQTQKDNIKVSGPLYERFYEAYRTNAYFKDKISRLPTHRTVRDTIPHYFTRGSITTDTSNRGRKKIQVTEEISYILQEAPMSTRGMSEALCNRGVRISHVTIADRLKKDLKMGYFRGAYGQELTERHIADRLKFQETMHLKLTSNEIDLNNIAFSDECMLGSTHFNRQNFGMWRMLELRR